MFRIISVDPDRCTGCRVCELACSLHNSGQCAPSRAMIRVARHVRDDLFWFTPLVCQRCARAVCIDGCEVGALTRDEVTGSIAIEEQRCTACGNCAERCPYGAIVTDPDSGIPHICTLCDGEPRCVDLCSTGALAVADKDDPGSHSGKKAMSTEHKRQRSAAMSANTETVGEE